jgi:Ca-activated chloride channel family protein
MKTSLRDMLNQARRFIAGEISGDYRFPHGFHFAPRGGLAYELMLDASLSMQYDDYPPSRFAAAKQAATGFLQKCVEQTPAALVGVIFYAESARIASPLLPAKTHFPQLRQAIGSGEIESATNIGAGLITAGQELMATGPAVSPAIVLLTDGYANTGPDAVQIASQLKEMGVRLDVIGIGGSPSHVNEAELKQMASILDGQLRYWFIRDTATLIRKFEALALGKL